MAAPNSILAQYLIASLGVAFTLFTFFTVYKIISLLCLSSSGSPTPTQVLQSENSTLQVETGGIPVEAVNSLPVIELTEAMGKGVKASDCAVCLGEFAKEDSLRFLPNCSHYFHIDCIDSWLKANSNCPLCRVKVSCELSKSGPSSSSVEAENSERTNQEGAVVDIHLLALETRESRDSGAAPVEVR